MTVTCSQLLFVSSNTHKCREISRLIGQSMTVLSLGDVGLKDLEIPETGSTFAENAAIKIEAVRARLRQDGSPFQELALLADDSGLVVDALNGAPGIYSARFAGERATDDDNNQKLMTLLREMREPARTAHYVCALAFQVTPDAVIDIVEARCDGQIVDDPRGIDGFGYDPYFYVPEFKRTMAELLPDEKDRVSHRGRAIRALFGV